MRTVKIIIIIIIIIITIIIIVKCLSRVRRLYIAHAQRGEEVHRRSVLPKGCTGRHLDQHSQHGYRVSQPGNLSKNASTILFFLRFSSHVVQERSCLGHCVVPLSELQGHTVTWPWFTDKSHVSARIWHRNSTFETRVLLMFDRTFVYLHTYLLTY